MSITLQLGHYSIPTTDIIPLLSRYQMLPQLLRESVIDQAIASIQCTPEETSLACQQFYEQHRLTSEVACQAWLSFHGMTSEQLEAMAVRSLKIEKFKQMTWEHKLRSYFLRHKSKFDQVVYSMLRTEALGVAQELYYRIQAGEQSFAEVARKYSEGPEALTSGLVGPIELGQLPHLFGQLFAVSQVGQLWAPIHWQNCFIVLRLEQFLPAQFNQSMRQRLLNELFESWLQEQLNQQYPSLHPQAISSQSCETPCSHVPA